MTDPAATGSATPPPTDAAPVAGTVTPPATPAQVIAENLRRLRVRGRFTQHEVVRLMLRNGTPITRSKYAAWELAQRQQVSMLDILNLATAFHVAPEELLYGDGDVHIAAHLILPRSRLRELVRGPVAAPVGSSHTTPAATSARSTLTMPLPAAHHPTPPPPAPGTATAPVGLLMPRAHRWPRLLGYTTTVHPSLTLWPGLLTGGVVHTLVGPAGTTAMALDVFLRSAVDLAVRVVYAHHLDHPEHDHPDRDGELVPFELGLVVQYPAPGGVVHTWTATEHLHGPTGDR
ncbi:hypothetical protein ALI22I_20085 [Saccharothrix sp. ALI-22-I]|uniref:helix-turn-helix transcriptional regulator n=1 Tax=Saccharothrix sp. ALI-22-I TaxID=1933778 RepID=UPI00097C168C|nr:helix-turn-helix domain-containing protein [Saccharothrix sp. ALI-22-I]ONI88045.1 hypothetical protein ALI22I_20085 [Saccharothrix sp. ALI-22-I]